MELEKIIAAAPLFHDLEQKHLTRLAQIVVRRIFKRGEVIFSEGDNGTGFHVIVYGKVKIFKLSPDGKEQILHIFGPGEPIGEVPVFSGQHFPASAEALADTLTLFFPRDDFFNLIRHEPSLALNMLSVLSMRLKRFASLIESLSLKEVPGRLAAYLLYLSERSGGKDELTLDISKSQLASVLGTIPETLSRILARMTKEGLLASEGKRRIIIKDRFSMKALSRGEKRLT